MYTSIKKFGKIQIHARHSVDGPSPNVINTSSLQMRKPAEHLTTLYSGSVNEIVGKQNLKAEIEYYGINSSLGEYFLEHASAWHDLKRKLHALIASGQKINQYTETKLASVFLRLPKDGHFTQEFLVTELGKQIFNNKNLLSNIESEPSLLDSSHEHLRFNFGSDEQNKFIIKMMKVGLESNQAIPEGADINSVTKQLINDIKPYLQSILGVDIDTIIGDKYAKIKNPPPYSQYVSNELIKKLFPDPKKKREIHPTEQKKAWTIIKAFYAWGNFNEIQTIANNAKQMITKIPEHLQALGISFIPSREEPRKEYSYQEEVEIHTGTIEYPDHTTGDTIKIKTEYRVKSIRSILLKLWETEEYNNIDALRDIIGVSFIFPDGTSPTIKEEVMAKLACAYMNRAYIVKNKGFLKNEKQFFSTLQNRDHRPFGRLDGIETKKNGGSKATKSSSSFVNASYSGFQEINHESFGVEFQFLEKEKYTIAKSEHKIYDPKKVIYAHARGYWHLTTEELITIVTKNIHKNSLAPYTQYTIPNVIDEYLANKDIIPFSSANENEKVYFVPKNHIERFKEKYTNMVEIDANNNKAFQEFMKDGEFKKMVESVKEKIETENKKK